MSAVFTLPYPRSMDAMPHPIRANWSAEKLAALDAWIATQPEPMTRPEAMRFPIAMALLSDHTPGNVCNAMTLGKMGQCLG